MKALAVLHQDNMQLLFFNVIPLPHSIDMQELLVKDGYKVDFWYLKDMTNLYPWQKLNKNVGYQIYKSGLKQFLKLLVSASESKLVIISGWHSKMHVLLALYCKFLGIRYCYWLDVPEPPVPGFKTTLKRWLLNFADALFVTGQSGIKFFIHEYHVNPDNCYDFPYLEVQEVPSNVYFINDQRHKALMNGDKIKLLLSNRFINRKGYRTVLNALRQLSVDDYQQLDVTILGTGSEKGIYEEEFARLGVGIAIKGWVEYDEYLQILMNSDLLIHASTHEPFGIPPLDAMRHGKLVIASKGVMSCLDRIEHGLNGYLFAPGDSNALASILLEIIRNRSLIYSMGKLAKKTSMCYGYTYNKKAIETFLEKIY